MYRLISVILLLSCCLFVGCKKAEIQFISYDDKDAKQESLQNPNQRWSVAMSKDDLVEIRSQLDVEYNTAIATKRKLINSMVFPWVKTGEEATAEIWPGTYDWLIIRDATGAGKIDSYYGTRTDQVQQKNYRFESGKRYKIIVRDESKIDFVTE
jgi:hypothetical protein